MYLPTFRVGGLFKVARKDHMLRQSRLHHQVNNTIGGDLRTRRDLGLALNDPDAASDILRWLMATGRMPEFKLACRLDRAQEAGANQSTTDRQRCSDRIHASLRFSPPQGPVRLGIGCFELDCTRRFTRSGFGLVGGLHALVWAGGWLLLTYRELQLVASCLEN